MLDDAVTAASDFADFALEAVDKEEEASGNAAAADGDGDTRNSVVKSDDDDIAANDDGIFCAVSIMDDCDDEVDVAGTGGSDTDTTEDAYPLSTLPDDLNECAQLPSMPATDLSEFGSFLE